MAMAAQCAAGPMICRGGLAFCFCKFGGLEESFRHSAWNRQLVGLGGRGDQGDPLQLMPRREGGSDREKKPSQLIFFLKKKIKLAVCLFWSGRPQTVFWRGTDTAPLDRAAGPRRSYSHWLAGRAGSFWMSIKHSTRCCASCALQHTPNPVQGLAFPPESACLPVCLAARP